MTSAGDQPPSARDRAPRLQPSEIGWIPMRSAVAVASHSFPKNQILRSELLSRYPESVFNETRSPLAGMKLVEFLRGHDKAITGLEVLDEAVFAAVPQLRIVSKYGVGLD